MTQTIYFVAGLPRSGSTLLCNILNQNPRFTATSTSGIVEVLRGIKDGWANVATFRSLDEHTMYAKLRQTLRATLYGYYADVDSPVVFDKSRAWLNYMEMAANILDHPVKALVTVRNLADVMASWELRYRETMGLGFVSAPQGVAVATVEDRIKWYASASHPIGSSFNSIKDAQARGYESNMHFIDFDALTSTPKTTLSAVYEFLGETPFEHNFDHVEQTTVEDDREHGFVGLHKIRTSVEKVPSRWKTVLGPAGESVAKQRCW